MSLVTELLERLAGVATLKEKVNDTAERVERLADWVLDLDLRVTRVESTYAAFQVPPRLPRK